MGKGAGKGKGKKKEPEPEDTGPPPPPPDLNNYVALSLKLMNWKFMDDSTVVTDETHLFTIKKKLEQKHGRMKQLVICKDSYAERNELRDDMKTLKDYGILGAQKPNEPAPITLFSPIRTPLQTIAPSPIHTLRSSTTGAVCPIGWVRSYTSCQSASVM